MNYLAHIYLSGDCPEIMVGGLLGDFVKGPLRGELPDSIEKGIRLHRKIDAFTDSLPEVKQAIQRIKSPYRRFGGILIDICYDHFLAANWSKFHSLSLETFCQNFYQLLLEYKEYLPQGARRFSELAPKNQWLETYVERDKLEYILERIGQRFRSPVALQKAFPQLMNDYSILENEFNLAFPKIVGFSKNQQEQHP